MRKKISKRKNEMPLTTKNILGILVSSVIGLAVTIILTLIFSLILTKSAIISSTVGAYFVGCVVFGSLIAGFIASKKCTFKGIISGVISSIPFALGITVLMLIFSNGQLNSKTGVLYIGIIICGILGGVCSANTKRRK